MQEMKNFVRRKKGTGSIQKDPRGGFRIRIPCGKTAENHTRYKTVSGFKSVTEAEEALNNALGGADINSGSKERKTFGDWLGEYLEDKRSTVNSGDVGVRPIKQRSFDSIECTAKLYLFERPVSERRKYQPTGEPLTGKTMDSITSEDVRCLLNHMEKQGLSRSSLKKVYDLINQVYRFAAFPSPAGFSFRANRSYRMAPPATFSSDELHKLEAYLKQLEEKQVSFSAAMALRFIIHTGCRVGEVCGFHCEDYNRGDNTITIRHNISFVRNNGYHPVETTPKSERSFRTIPLSVGAVDAVESALRQHSGGLRDGRYVFATKTGAPQDPTNLYRLLRSAMDGCGIEHVPGKGIHALRHSFVSSMIAKGVTAERIALYVGNDPMITARIYTHALSANDLRFISGLDD